ncbi:hypothetical protein D3C86_1629000 [compost metagenome]
MGGQGRIGLVPQSPENLRCRDGLQRIGQNQEQFRQIGDRFNVLANAARDQGSALKAHRHIRSKLQGHGGKRIRCHPGAPVPQKPSQRRRRVRRTAADARCHRQVLFKVNGDRACWLTRRRKSIAQQISGAGDEIVAAIPGAQKIAEGA